MRVASQTNHATEEDAMRIDYVKRTKPAGACLHHVTTTRVQLAAEAMRQAGLTSRPADLSQLPVCTCH